MGIRVINKHWAPREEQARAFYVGRGSPLGNPNAVKPHGPHTREEAILLYEQHLREHVRKRTPSVVRELNRIYAHAKANEETLLLCFCAPHACHADVIKRLIEEKLPVPSGLGARH